MRTQILFEDKDILVCFKPAGLAVQSARVSEPDMESELKNYLARSRRTPEGRGPVYLGVVHRLDQPVSGLLVFAKSACSAAALSAQASGGGMEKLYRAAVALPENGARAAGSSADARGSALFAPDRAGSGSETPESGVPEPLCPGRWTELTDWLIREPGGGGRIADAREPGAKAARLSYTCLETAQDRALLEIRLDTGRHHQIRLQLAHAGMPLLGDERYGTPYSRALSQRIGVRGLQLQAVRLAFHHPRTGKRVCYELEKKLELLS